MPRHRRDERLGLPPPPARLPLLLLLLAAAVPLSQAGEPRAQSAAPAGGAGRDPWEPACSPLRACRPVRSSPLKLTSRGCPSVFWMEAKERASAGRWGDGPGCSSPAGARAWPRTRTWGCVSPNLESAGRNSWQTNRFAPVRLLALLILG